MFKQLSVLVLRDDRLGYFDVDHPVRRWRAEDTARVISPGNSVDTLLDDAAELDYATVGRRQMLMFPGLNHTLTGLSQADGTVAG